MLQYTKAILSKLSLRKNLFRKELINRIRRMDERDRFECYKWCRAKYYHLYPDIIEEAFQDIFRAVRFI